MKPEVGMWWVPCCIEDIQQIDVDTLQHLEEDIANDEFFGAVYRTLGEALDVLQGDEMDVAQRDKYERLRREAREKA